VNLINSVLQKGRGVPHYTGSRLLETRSRQRIWKVTLYNLLPSTLASHVITHNGNVYRTLAQTATCLTTMKRQTYCKKRSIGQSNNNSLVTLLGKKLNAKLREVVNTRAEMQALLPLCYEEKPQNLPWKKHRK